MRKAGPPRFGLKPGVGLQPGHDPAYDLPTTARKIHYPSTSIFPGRGLTTFLRRITRPSTSIYPGTDLLIRSIPKGRSQAFLVAGNALQSLVRVSVGRRRTLSVAGVSVMSISGTSSSAPVTKMSVEVALADAYVTVPLGDAAADAPLGDLILDVAL